MIGLRRNAPDVIHRVVWNAKEGRNPDKVIAELDRWLAGREPHLVSLLEAASYVKAVRRHYRRRYRVLAAYGWPEAGNIITLVRRDVPLAHWRTLRMKLGWIGPKRGKRHVGRTDHIIDLGRGRNAVRWRFLVVHRVPGGPTGGVVTHGRNQPAYAEEHRAIRRLGCRRGSLRRAFVCDGDQNAEANDGHPLSPATLAEDLDCEVIETGAKVDWAFARGCTGEGRAHRNVGGDHPLIAYRYEYGGTKE